MEVNLREALILDLTEENASLQIFPSKPLISSRKKSWNNIQIESYLLPAHQAPEHSPEQNAIIIFHQPLKVVKRMLGDEFKDEHIKTGDVVVGSSKVSHSACWDEEASFTVMSFEPKFIARVASEFIDPDRVKILPHFAQSDPVIYEIGLTLKSELESGQENNKMYVDSAAIFLATHLIKHYSVIQYNVKEDADTLSHSNLRQVIEYMDVYLNQNVGLTELADLVGLSQCYFARLFKKSTGISPAQYLIKLRLEKVTRLLGSTKLSVDEIAQQTGFSSHSYLCRMFRKYRSVTPAQYRKMC